MEEDRTINVRVILRNLDASGNFTRIVTTQQRILSTTVVTAPSSGGGGSGNVPAGGETGDYLVKASNTDYDLEYTKSLSPVDGLFTNLIGARTGTEVEIDADVDILGVIRNNGVPLEFGTYAMGVLKVAASNATVEEQARADFQCDGTADDVQIQTALNNASIVELSSGDFTLANPIYIEGDGTTESPNKALIGRGSELTFIRPASGTDAIVLQDIPKPRIEDLQIILQGTSDGITSIAPVAGPTDRRGFWQGYFRNIYIKGDFSTHTGWAINMENPFRSTFVNIQGNGINNGVWLKSTYTSFNPGNCVWIDCHMDLSQANGTAYFLESADDGGFMNIMTFIECDCIDSESTSTTSIGWRFKGSTTSFYTTRDMLVLRSNVELFNRAVVFEHAANIEMNLNYVDTKTGGTVVDLSSDSVNNVVTMQYLYVPSPKTVEAFADDNTDALKPNILRHAFARVETGGTLTLTPSTATVIGQLSRDSDGSGTYPTQWQGQTTPLIVQDEGTDLFRGTRRINFTGAGVTATNSGPDVTVNISGGGGGSGITRTVVSSSGNFTAGATANTDYVYFLTGAHIPTMPTAVGNTNRYSFCNEHSASITFATTSSQTIDGGTLTLGPGESVDLISNNANWRIF